jgi:hypothetical protein
MKSRGLKVSDVYCGDNFADVQIAPILNKLPPIFYIHCYLSVIFKNRLREVRGQIKHKENEIYGK